ncbi:hypothetical protein [Nonomuraea sp. NPDC003709]|uniref:hypothetical protein n=1 Tax=Nonomuraea sp. NPDC003709 TaxID=3154450 RepID=UPI0033AD3391
MEDAVGLPAPDDGDGVAPAPSGSQSQDALDHLSHVFPEVSGTSARMVVVLPEHARADVPAVRSAVQAAARDIERLDQVAAAEPPLPTHGAIIALRPVL